MISPRVVLPLAIFFTAAPLTLGAAQKVDSKLTYRNSIESPQFVHEGEVKSALRKCERSRTVRLFGEKFDQSFASDKTDENGQWRITQDQDGLASDYYARVSRVQRGGVICKADESPHKPLS